MLRGVPRSLAYVAQQHNRRSQLRWNRGCCAATLRTMADMSGPGFGRGASQLGNTQLVGRVLPLPVELVARAMSSSAASREKPWSGELVVPEMDGECGITYSSVERLGPRSSTDSTVRHRAVSLTVEIYRAWDSF